MKKLLTSLLLITSSALAQVQTTPNLAGTTVNPAPAGVSYNWTGFTVTNSTGGGVSGGNQPGYNTTTGQFMFGYTQGTIAYNLAINSALSGSGVKIGGIEYGASYYNQGEMSGTLSVTAAIKSNTGSILQSYNHNLPQTTAGWTQWNMTQSFVNPYSLSAVGDATLSFTGKDSRFWAGYYGPQFKNPHFRFNYTVDPCSTNPAYSSSCANYNTVLTSENLLPGITGTQAYAINQALAAAGAGATIHGFDYGYSYNVPGRQCAMFDLFGFCLTGWNYSDAGVATVITNNNNEEIYSHTTTHNGGDNGVSGNYVKNYRFDTSLPMSTLGGFAMSPWKTGTATINNMWSNAVYTADPCLANPLHATSCPGYAAAYLNQQCGINVLYDSSCPGYAAAYLSQQCSINQLYSPSCPGYAAAYLTQQCSLNPLYATQCPGYEQAYLNAQCIKDSLYSNKCEGYATAYAIKYLTPISTDSTVSNAVNGSLSDTAAVKANDPANTKVAVNTVTTTVNTDGTVSTGVSKTGDTNVDKVITPPTTTANSSAAPAAPVQLAPPPPPAQRTAQGGSSERKQEERKDASGTGPSSSSNNQTASSQEGKSSGDKPKTTREELQERRVAAAKAEAVETGKKLAESMSKVADMESQILVQNVVIQAMGYTPGFDSYSKTMLPDVAGYKPFTVYNNQKNIDNARLGRSLFGPTDRLHTEMIDAQYKK